MRNSNDQISAAEIDKILPQTQCGDCGYAGCMPYAQAMAQNQASINLCPPGGVETLKKLATLLNVDAEPYLAEVKEKTRPPAIAVIREAECIGCTKCIQACPVDAIIGSSKSMHTIIGDECTGCGLCIEPCPVDCIDLVEKQQYTYNRELARKRYNTRKIRLLRQEQEKQQAYRDKKRLSNDPNKIQDKTAKQKYILEALERVKSKYPGVRA